MEIIDILGKLPGVVRVARLDAAQRAQVVQMEARSEGASILPVRNIGVRLLGDRDACFALLKDSRFRPPKVPTVYLVEEGAQEDVPQDVPRGHAEPPEARHEIVVEGVRYRVVGEEVIEGKDHSSEVTIPLEKSFVIFPSRRSGQHVPCTFILPPISFPELERDARRLGIFGVLSISPSLAADTWIRETFGFPPTNSLATLLVGCDISSP